MPHRETTKLIVFFFLVGSGPRAGQQSHRIKLHERRDG